MMKKLLWWGVWIALVGCQQQPTPGSDKRLEEIPVGGNAADIIRNPASAEGLRDTSRLAKIAFEETEFNFGEVNEGDIVTHVFNFTNIGKVPLVIGEARSSCGCTVPEYPKTPIAPGERGSLKVRFNTLDKPEAQVKIVTVVANTYPSHTELRLVGYVHPKQR